MMRAANLYSLFYVFMSSPLITAVTLCRCSEHSQDWHTTCWSQLATVRCCVRLLLTGAVCVCSYVVCMLLISGWCAAYLSLVCD